MPRPRPGLRACSQSHEMRGRTSARIERRCRHRRRGTPPCRAVLAQLEGAARHRSAHQASQSRVEQRALTEAEAAAQPVAIDREAGVCTQVEMRAEPIVLIESIVEIKAIRRWRKTPGIRIQQATTPSRGHSDQGDCQADRRHLVGRRGVCSLLGSGTTPSPCETRPPNGRHVARVARMGIAKSRRILLEQRIQPMKRKEKNPAARSCGGFWGKDPGDDLLSHAECTLPSAHARFTSEFGMGSGGSTQLLSPGRGWRVAVGSMMELQRSRSHWVLGRNDCKANVDVSSRPKAT